MISSLPLRPCLYSMFGRDSGVIPCSECYWRTAKQKCTAVQEFQNCSPLLFWGIFQRENWLILGTSLYCHPFSPWLLSCVSDPACRVQRCLHLPVLHTGCSTKILVFHSPINSVLFLWFWCFLQSCLPFIGGHWTRSDHHTSEMQTFCESSGLADNYSERQGSMKARVAIVLYGYV